jgi:transcriptional regulator with XRE-family HTH domain
MEESPRVDPKKLRRLRFGRYWIQKELAQEAGLHKETVRRIEAGQDITPRLSTLLALANALDVEPGELLEDPHQNGGALGRPADFGQFAFEPRNSG